MFLQFLINAVRADGEGGQGACWSLRSTSRATEYDRKAAPLAQELPFHREKHISNSITRPHSSQSSISPSPLSIKKALPSEHLHNVLWEIPNRWPIFLELAPPQHFQMPIPCRNKGSKCRTPRARRTLRSCKLQHLQAPFLRRLRTSPQIPRARRVLGSEPL